MNTKFNSDNYEKVAYYTEKEDLHVCLVVPAGDLGNRSHRIYIGRTDRDIYGEIEKVPIVLKGKLCRHIPPQKGFRINKKL